MYVVPVHRYYWPLLPNPMVVCDWLSLSNSRGSGGVFWRGTIIHACQAQHRECCPHLNRGVCGALCASGRVSLKQYAKGRYADIIEHCM